jgi:(1->4)-alpha-D-glucan 1-alpha-D-glucosylmutase
MNGLAGWVERVAKALCSEINSRASLPRSTYRVQFTPRQMMFHDAAKIVPYLHALGISHLFASPYGKARTGSLHGYAIVDYRSLNPELGTGHEFEEMVQALRDRGMGQILDIVPNHMSAAPGENVWWTDVLENGPGSPYAHYFDIDWHPAKEELCNRVMLPLLGEQYGEVLESGRLQLAYDDGEFVLRVDGLPLPIDPSTYPQVLARHPDRLDVQFSPESPEFLELQSILTALEHLPDRNQLAPNLVQERQREKELIKKRLKNLVESCSIIAEHIAANVRELNGVAGHPDSFDELDRLLNAQAYRLAHWKSSGDEINYRRFFDINDLAAVCMEDPNVFEASHQFVLDLLVQRKVTGLRIDHIDGLFDPTDYLHALQVGYVRMLGEQVYATMVGKRDEGDCPSQPAEAVRDVPAWSELESLVV